MRKRTKSIIGVIAAGAAVAGVATTAVAASRTQADPPAEQRVERQYTAAHATDAHVSQSDAERRATAVRPGRLVESHLETEGNGLRWEVKTDDGTQVWEVQLDPATGRVVSNQPDE